MTNHRRKEPTLLECAECKAFFELNEEGHYNKSFEKVQCPICDQWQYYPWDEYMDER